MNIQKLDLKFDKDKGCLVIKDECEQLPHILITTLEMAYRLIDNNIGLEFKD